MYTNGTTSSNKGSQTTPPAKLASRGRREGFDVMKTNVAMLFSILALALAMPAAADPNEENVDVQVRDLELRDQYDERRRLKSDVIGDKLVAMTFIHSSCTTICPRYNALFTQIQEQLGDRLGKEVVLVTLTLDPTTDVPLRLRKEAKKYRAKPGWFYLTGKKSNVDQVLRGLDAYFADFTQHPPMALIGDGKTGTWKRYNRFPQPEQIIEALDRLAAARSQ